MEKLGVYAHLKLLKYTIRRGIISLDIWTFTIFRRPSVADCRQSMKLLVFP